LSVNYAAVAGSVVLGTPGVRACLVLSPDGLPLAAHPQGEEAAATAVWSRLSALGPVSRGFVTVRSEVWAFVQGERHGVLVLADRTVRPGQLLELVDQVLAEAAAAAVIAGGLDRRQDDSSSGSGAQRDARGERVRRFSTPLHREGHQPEADPASPDVVLPIPEHVGAGSAPEATEAAAAAPATVQLDTGASPQPTDEAAAVNADSEGEPPSAGPNGPTAPEGRAGGEVDIVALAREFAGILNQRDV
jgi:hypothetical protein